MINSDVNQFTYGPQSLLETNLLAGVTKGCKKSIDQDAHINEKLAYKDINSQMPTGRALKIANSQYFQKPGFYQKYSVDYNK